MFFIRSYYAGVMVNEQSGIAPDDLSHCLSELNTMLQAGELKAQYANVESIPLQRSVLMSTKQNLVGIARICHVLLRKSGVMELFRTHSVAQK